MTDDRAKAHGRATHAVAAWLHGRTVGDVSLHRPLDHDDVPEPPRDQIEDEIRLRLADAVGAMIHVGGKPVDHLTADRPEVQHALNLARKLPDDPIDHLERILEDLCASLTSPRIKRAVDELAASLCSAARQEMSADEIGHMITRSIRRPLASSDVGEPYPRTIFVRGA
jgi:hypothetical protein